MDDPFGDAPPPVGNGLTGDGLTVAEAATVYGTSVSTVRRLLSAGRLSGARRLPGPKGPEYRIPPAAMEALGYIPASSGPATVRSTLAEAQIERLGGELAATRAERDEARHAARLADERAYLIGASLEDLRTAVQRLPEPAATVAPSTAPPPVAAPPPPSATTPGATPWWLALAALAALVGIAVAAVLTRSDVEVNVTQPTAAGPTPSGTGAISESTTPVPPTTPAASSSAPTATAPTPTTVALTAVAPTAVAATTSSAVTPTTAAPTTVAATSTTIDALVDARASYLAITAAWNPVLARIDRDFDRLTENTARDVCALLANAYRGLYLEVQSTAWPSSVRSQIDVVVLTAASLEQELRRCARARSGWTALDRAHSPAIDVLTERLGRAATEARLALGIPTTPGLVLPDREV